MYQQLIQDKMLIIDFIQRHTHTRTGAFVGLCILIAYYRSVGSQKRPVFLLTRVSIKLLYAKLYRYTVGIQNYMLHNYRLFT